MATGVAVSVAAEQSPAGATGANVNAPALSVRASRNVKASEPVNVRGSLRPGVSGREVAIELRTRAGWRRVDKARTSAGGRFAARWRPSGPGRFRLRVRFRGDRLGAARTRTVDQRVNVYRASRASWFGPGLYGRRTGCGGTLAPGTLGVAHRTLPCRTRVTFRYGGRTVTVPVIDRGPYTGNREWDLTGAAKRALGFGSTGTVWATS